MADTRNYQEPVLTSLGAVEEWSRETRSSGTNGGSLQILEEPFQNSTATAWCPVVILNSYGESAATEQAAAVAMALHHLNVGDGTMVPQLEGLPDRCPIRFSLHTLDTTNIEVVANLTLNGVAMPCAIVGAGSSSISIVTSIFTGIQGIPQISPTSTSSKLSNRMVHPLFGRTIPSDADNLKVYLDFFKDVLKIRHLTVLYGNDEYGGSIKDDLSNLNGTEATLPPIPAEDMIQPFLIPVDDNPFSIKQAADMIRDRQFKYIWSLLPASLADEMMRSVSDADGYHWFFGDVFSPVLYQREFHPNSLLESAYRGAGILEATGQGLPEFHDQLLQLDNPSDLDFMESILPPGLNVQSVLQQGSSNIGFSVFAYQAAIAIGLAACQGQQQLYLEGTTHFDHIMNLTLHQMSGETVSFLPATGSRNPATATYRVRNYLPTTTSNGTIKFRDVTTHEYYNGTWKQLEEFIFQDGTSIIPPDLEPITVVQEVISPGVRITLLILCGIIIFLSSGFIHWTERNKKSKVVLASQPFFLHTICFGIIILGSAIIPITIDHGLGTGEWQKACTARVWLIALGAATTLVAFLAKTYRVNRILNNPNKFKRIKVSVAEVAVPMIASLVVDVVILAVMTKLAPPEYEKLQHFDQFGRVIQVDGRCNYDQAQPYMVALTVLNLLILVLAGWESFKARKLSTEFSESRYVFRALVATLTVTFTGVPLLFLTDDNPNALAFALSSIIFVASTSILLFMFVPKIQQINRATSAATDTHANKARVVTMGGSKGPRWRISGLEGSNSRIILQNRPMLGTTATYPTSDKNGGNTTANFTMPTTSSSSDLKGMKVLTMKTRSELFEENEYLLATLDEMNHLIVTCDNIETLRVALALSKPDKTSVGEGEDPSSDPIVSKRSESIDE